MDKKLFGKTLKDMNNLTLLNSSLILYKDKLQCSFSNGMLSKKDLKFVLKRLENLEKLLDNLYKHGNI
jgi:hypothetical protein